MEEWGHGKVIMKSDGEPAIRALKKKVKARRTDNITLMEVTPRGDPKANGEAESAVREIKGVARSIKSGLEQRSQEKLPADSPILPWIVEHAGVCVTVYRKGRDGKTPYHRLKGKEFSGRMYEIGEKVLFKELNDQQQLGGWDSRWSEGIWVGYDLATYQSIIATPEGRTKANTVRQVPAEKRWSSEGIDEISIRPWEDHKPRGPRERTIGPRKERQSGSQQEVPQVTEEEKEESWGHKGSRAFRIRKEDILEHDPTPGCPACAHAVGPEGAARTGGHTAECRKRFTDILMRDPARKVFVESSERRKRTEKSGDLAQESKRTKIETTTEPPSHATASTATNSRPESAAAKRERAHDELPIRPGEEEDDEPEVEEESIGKRRRILTLGSCRVVLEMGSEGLRAMKDHECEEDAEEEWKWEVDRAVRRMKVELKERRKLIAMLHDRGAKSEDEEHIVGMLRDEWLSKGRPQSGTGNITWRAQDERKEILHKVRRNWCLPTGQVFDMRAPDAWGEKWDFS